MPTALGGRMRRVHLDVVSLLEMTLGHRIPTLHTIPARPARCCRASESSCHFFIGTGDAPGSWMLRDDTLHQRNERQNGTPMVKPGRGHLNGHDPLREPPPVELFQGCQDLAWVSLTTEARSHQAQGS